MHRILINLSPILVHEINISIFASKSRNMAKISVTHYLNKRLKPSYGIGKYQNELAYPIYIRISYGRKNQRIRSQWLHFDATEREFANDLRIQEIIKYETEIIEDVLNNINDNDLYLNTGLMLYLCDLTNNYLACMFGNLKEISRYIVQYLTDKTHFSENLIIHSTNIEYAISNYYTHIDWYELLDNNVFPENIKHYIIYLSLLYEFESIYYCKKDDAFDYEIGSILNLYEWKNKEANKKFIAFAKAKNILDKVELDRITQEFNNNLKEYIKGAVRFNFTSMYR